MNRAKANTGLGILLITHYTRILRYIKPDFVHVFVDGRIAEQGGPELADRLEDEGYDRYLVARRRERRLEPWPTALAPEALRPGRRGAQGRRSTPSSASTSSTSG